MTTVWLVKIIPTIWILFSIMCLFGWAFARNPNNREAWKGLFAFVTIFAAAGMVLTLIWGVL